MTTNPLKNSDVFPKTLPDLAHFIGTQNYYKHTLGNMRFTDGVKHVADTAQAYWLLDVLFSHAVAVYASNKIPADQKRLLVCKLERCQIGDSALFIVKDGDYNLLATQVIEFTDFPAMEQTFWVQNGVAMLPSEY